MFVFEKFQSEIYVSRERKELAAFLRILESIDSEKHSYRSAASSVDTLAVIISLVSLFS